MSTVVMALVYSCPTQEAVQAQLEVKHGRNPFTNASRLLRPQEAQPERPSLAIRSSASVDS